MTLFADPCRTCRPRPAAESGPFLHRRTTAGGRAGQDRLPAHRKTGTGGFTLLEILAAMAILAIVLTALFQLHLQTLSLGADTRFYTMAPLLAQKTIARIEAEGIEQVRTDSGGFGDGLARYRWEADVSEIASAEFEEEVQSLRRIDVTVRDEGDGSAYRLRTYRYIP